MDFERLRGPPSLARRASVAFDGAQTGPTCDDNSSHLAAGREGQNESSPAGES